MAVGKIARRSPHRVAKDIALIQRFFEAMSQVREDAEACWFGDLSVSFQLA